MFSPTGCGDNDHGTGVCQDVDYIGSYKTKYVDVDDESEEEYTMSACSHCPDWWSAQSWCKAHGKTMVSLSDLHCTSSGCTDNLWEDLGNTLYKKVTWTTNMFDSCKAFGIYLADGTLGRGTRDYTSLDVLCR